MSRRELELLRRVYTRAVGWLSKMLNREANS